jgi:hypothetical protein
MGRRGTGALFGNKTVLCCRECSMFSVCMSAAKRHCSWERSHGIEASVGDLSGLQAEQLVANAHFSIYKLVTWCDVEHCSQIKDWRCQIQLSRMAEGSRHRASLDG